MQIISAEIIIIIILISLLLTDIIRTRLLMHDMLVFDIRLSSISWAYIASIERSKRVHSSYAVYVFFKWALTFREIYKLIAQGNAGFHTSTERSPNWPDVNPIDYCMGVLQDCVYRVRVTGLSERKQSLSRMKKAVPYCSCVISQWRRCVSACVRVIGGYVVSNAKYISAFVRYGFFACTVKYRMTIFFCWLFCLLFKT